MKQATYGMRGYEYLIMMSVAIASAIVLNYKELVKDSKQHC